MRRPPARGFSLLTVLMVLVVLALTAMTALTLSTQEAGTARTYTMRKQAFAAAEAGLTQFKTRAQPSLIADEYYIGGPGSADGDYMWLADIPSGDGGVLQARYRVRGVGPGPLPATGLVVVEGEVLSDGNVVGRAALSVILGLDDTGQDAGTGQKAVRETGANADRPGSTTLPITLMPKAPEA